MFHFHFFLSLQFLQTANNVESKDELLKAQWKGIEREIVHSAPTLCGEHQVEKWDQ